MSEKCWLLWRWNCVLRNLSGIMGCLERLVWRNKNPRSVLIWTCKANSLMPSAQFSAGTIRADVCDCGYELHIIDSQRCLVGVWTKRWVCLERWSPQTECRLIIVSSRRRNEPPAPLIPVQMLINTGVVSLVASRWCCWVVKYTSKDQNFCSCLNLCFSLLRQRYFIYLMHSAYMYKDRAH